MSITKRPYCIYDPKSDIEYADGCFKIFLPTDKGYVNYNVVHSLRPEITANVWRLGQVFAYDDDLNETAALTRFGAEWDMAIHIIGRDDFIGGSNHGDELFYSISLNLDGRYCDIRSITELTPFDTLTVSAESAGYDPDDHTTKVLLHRKDWTFDPRGVTTAQKIEFLGEYTLNNSYLAMMPPLKVLTDTYFTGLDTTPKDIVIETVLEGEKSATLYGKDSGVYYTMSIPEYPTGGGARFIITDNNKSPYNKMYFLVCTLREVVKGEVWNSVTRHEIAIGIAEGGKS